VKTVFKCPECGQPHRLPAERAGEKVMCLACGDIFEAGAKPKEKKGRKPRASKESVAIESGTARLVKQIWGDPAVVLDGVIPGAISGIIVGFLIGILYLGSDMQSPEAIGGAIGATFNRVLMGLGLGIVLGIFFGSLVAAGGRFIRRGVALKPGWAAIITGFLTGLATAAFVGDAQWALWGAGFGAGIASVWPLLCSWVEAAQAARPASSDEDEEYVEEREAKVNRRHGLPDTVLDFGDSDTKDLNDAMKSLRLKMAQAAERRAAEKERPRQRNRSSR
jgi:hypothetical protein